LSAPWGLIPGRNPFFPHYIQCLLETRTPTGQVHTVNSSTLTDEWIWDFLTCPKLSTLLSTTFLFWNEWKRNSG
jgi:hypothetical protein